MNAAYTDLKPAWHLDKIAELRRGEQIVPAQIQLIISDLCNHNCGFCAYRMEGYASNQHFGTIGSDGTVNNNPPRFIPTAKAIEIIKDAAAMGVKAVQFTGGGEPTVHPDHLTIFRAALEAGLQCALVTNGCLLREGWEEVLSRFAWVRVSLDAGTAETYAKIRAVPERTFDKCLENIRRLAGARGGVVGVSYIVLQENYRECRRAAVAARQAGADSIRFGAVFSTRRRRYYDGIESGCVFQVEQADAESRPGFAVVDMFTQRLSDLSAQVEHPFCGYQQFNVYIGGDLNVYRCCDTAYNDRGLTGSLKEQTFAQFWLSDAKQRAYESFDARGCELCAFRGKNEVINYLVGPEAADRNLAFV